MSALNLVIKRIGLVAIIFIVLSILFTNKSLRQAHNNFYTSIATPLFNTINPHVYATFIPEAPDNPNGWDISFTMYDKRVHGNKVKRANYRKANQPTGMLFQNHHELIIVPTLFLLALFFSSPITWKQIAWRLPLGLFSFYVFMTMYFSYRFELTINQDNLQLDSIWHLLITFFGLGGNIDPIYIVALFIWAIITIPTIIKTHFK